ncbi:hypothetical protein SAMN05216474_0787 [Lishizhenia tianjinensis]|uniref:Uncharacterized protein n=1 Tax=Lishizhenia tianjinensis TaxID=477690 RepID=A0A1I6YBV5_9FLAO|nr:hypothetical protein SAMN05216474_0787 [Lishizhenia tianjinensis]
MNSTKGRISISDKSLSIKNTFGTDVINRERIFEIRYRTNLFWKVTRFFTLSPVYFINALKGKYHVELIYRETEYGSKKEKSFMFTPAEIQFLRENL